VLKRRGLKEVHAETADDEDSGKEIALLGFFRTASSLVHEIIAADEGLKDRLVVVDFNPEVHAELQNLGIKVIYGDISHPDTLHHAGIHEVKMIISTIPDTVLVGTDNLRIIRHLREICPHAKIIVTAESTERALKMYAEGADYVFLPRVLAARNLLDAVRMLTAGNEKEFAAMVRRETAALECRTEVIR
jgi:voltage-gated potassium channel Kch